jgi:hypothetical protein
MRRRFTFAAAALISALAILPAIALASSHSEAPGTAKDRLADDTDTYAFVSPDAPGTVTLIGNWVPLEEPAGGPNFYAFDDDAWYYINVDNVGDAQDHIRFEFKFTTHVRNGATFLYNTGPITSLDDADFNVYQTYTVRRSDNGGGYVTLGSDLPVPPNHIGPASTPNYDALAQAAVRTLSDGSKVFAGQRDDPFFVDLGGVFDLLTIRKPPGNKGKGVDGVGGYNVLEIALQVPVTRLTQGGAPLDSTNAVIGMYTSVERYATRTLNADGTVSHSGAHVQVSRLGHPLVNEVVIARQDKDKFNASHPTGDGQFLSYVTNPELPNLLHLLYGISVPPTPRLDLVEVFLTGIPGLNHPIPLQPAELLRLNMMIPASATPNRMGVLGGDLAGFPNGRRLADDVTDIELRAVAGVLVNGFDHPPNNQLGDGIDFNDRPYLASFPYEATPHSGFEHTHHPKQMGKLRLVKPWLGGGFNAQAIREALENESLEIDADEAGETSATARKPMLRMAGANPGPRADLEYTLATSGRVSLAIFDVQGRAVRTLFEQHAAAGTFRASWDGVTDSGRRAGRGVFFARLVVDGRVEDRRKIVIE